MGAIGIVTPLAPRDLGLLHVALESQAAALMYLADSRMLSEAFSRAQIDVVVDGSVTRELTQHVHATMRGTFKHVKGLDITPRVTFLAERSGPGVARNAALADYEDDTVVFFLDADDIMYPWGLNERLFLHLLAQEPILAYGQMVLHHDHPQHGKLMQIRQCAGSKQLLQLQKHNNVLIPGMVSLPAGHILAAGGFEPHLICGEDGNLFRRVLEKGLKPMSRDVPVMIYRYRENSQSKMATSDPDVAAFNDKAFHLGTDWSKHGPMGQNLDEAANLRADNFFSARVGQRWGDQLDAIAPGVAIEDQVVVTFGG